MSSDSRVAPKRLNKPNEILVMVPRTGRLTLVGRKLYNVLLHHSQAKLKRGVPDATEYFEAPLSTLLEPVGAGESDYRSLAKRYLVEMQDVTMEWDSPESTAGSEWKRLKLLSEVELVKRNNETWVRWALPPTLVQGLADPLKWTSLELTVLSKLTTYAAVALYEICARFKNNPSGVTSRKATTWWIDALSNSAAPIDQATGQPKRREWRKFKNEFVLPAIEQINEQTDLELELLEFKAGRAINEVQLAVRKKLPRVSAPAPVNASLLERGVRAGLTDRELDQLLQSWSSAKVGEALERLEQRQAMQGVEEVRSALGYMRFLLGRAEAAQEIADRPESLAPIARATSVKIEIQRQTEPEPSAAQARRDEIASSIASLSQEEQRALLHEVVESLKRRGLLTPSIARRAGQGDWIAAGLLRSEMINLHATRQWGAAWESMEVTTKSDTSTEA